MKIAIVGTPRSGSSYLASLMESLGLKPLPLESTVAMNPSQFNPQGYFEDTFFNLLTDQLIRYEYGNGFSFLNPPLVGTVQQLRRYDDWSFDLDESSLEIPEDYALNLENYCGSSWDVWGLTRMLSAGKWNKIYSRLRLSNTSDLLDSLQRVRDTIILSEDIYVKDARLVFVMNYFFDLFTHIVFLTRERKGLSKSMQSHYGPRIFVGPEFEGYKWVSNHFNYKVPLVSIDQFVSRYESAAILASRTCNLYRIQLDEIDTETKASNWLKSVGLYN